VDILSKMKDVAFKPKFGTEAVHKPFSRTAFRNISENISTSSSDLFSKMPQVSDFKPAKVFALDEQNDSISTKDSDSLNILRTLPRAKNQAFKPAEVTNFSDEEAEEKWQKIPEAVNQEFNPGYLEEEEVSSELMNNLPQAKNLPFQPSKATFSNEGNKSIASNNQFRANGRSDILHNMPSMNKHQVFRPAIKETKVTNSEEILNFAPSAYNRAFEPAYIAEPKDGPATEIFQNMPHANNKKFQPASVSEEWSNVSSIMDKVPRANFQRFQPASDFLSDDDSHGLIDGRASRSGHFEPASKDHSHASEQMWNIPKAKNKKFRPAVPGNGGMRTFQRQFDKAEKGTDEVMRLMDSVPRNRERFRPSPMISNDRYSPALLADPPLRLAFNPSEPLKSSKPMFKPSKPKW